MRVCVFGAQGAGKSTTAAILERALSFRLPHIRGDDFILPDSADLNSLRSRLSRSNGFILDHVSAPGVLRALGIVPDLAICLEGQHRTNEVDDASRMAHRARQLQMIVDAGCPLVRATSATEAISLCLPRFRDAGLFPNASASFVIKVASKCNLNCSYCYMYQALDGAWRDAPAAMSERVARQVGLRLAEHSDANDGLRIAGIIHGGEPLALGPPTLSRLVRAMQAELGDRPAAFTVQTNGTLITPEYLTTLDEIGLHIGISIDGTSMVGNRHRVHHSGESAHGEIMRGIDACLSHEFQRGSFGGALCVVDPETDGRQTYGELRRLGLQSFDFLLRDEQHTSAPGGSTARNSAARFLCSAFDAWIEDSSPCDVRLFQAMVAQVIGANYSTDSVGLQPMDAMAVSVTGEWELLDILRICFDGAWQTPYTVFNRSVEEVSDSPEYQRMFGWQYDLSDKCLRCDHLAECGGGYLPHRYHPDTQFRNPSVHCEALYTLIGHIKARLGVAIAQPQPTVH